jgi:protocatechuate 3,4-dioxygenase beta subunit
MAIAFCRFYLLSFLCCATLQSAWGQVQARKTNQVATLIAQLDKSHSRSDYETLHALLSEYYSELSQEERESLRQALRKNANWANETLCTANEKGTTITISGRVIDAKGMPIVGAHLHLYQTDAKGFYSPTDATTGKMNEQDPRLEGFLITDHNGNYSFTTIRPASYPKPYQGRLIPQHIHINITAKGYAAALFQMVFADDPAMNDYWVDWAKKANFPIVSLEYAKTGVRGNKDLTMTKN